MLVSDNGAGYPDPVPEAEESGFGLIVIRALVEPHQGSLELSNDNDARARVVL